MKYISIYRPQIYMRYLCMLVLWIASAFVCRGQEAAADTVISVVTFYPGSDIYELEGHTTLRVRMPMQDYGVSWGLFDFDAPNFVYRFVKGETDYMMGIIPWPYLEAQYHAQGRRIVEQRLNLDSMQKKRLLGLLADNYRPENRTYRYNYVLDNCATRPLAIIEQSVGDTVTVPEPTGEAASQTTFRSMMRMYHRNYPWYQLGIDIALGPTIDKPVTARQKTFAPVAMFSQLEGATAAGRPLTAGTTVISDVPEDNAVLGATPWYLNPVTVSFVIFIVIAFITLRDWRRDRPTRWLDCLYDTIVGLAGCLVVFLVFVSSHYATSPNWLLLWLNPLPLAVAAGVWIKGAEKLVFCLQIAIFALVLAGIMIWPFTGQYFNPALLPLVAATLLRAGLYIALGLRKTKHLCRQ